MEPGLTVHRQAWSAPGGKLAPERFLPRWVLGLALGMLGTLLVLLAALRLGGFQPAQQPAATVTERLLVFSDTPDGAVSVADARSGHTLALMRGEQGFLRGVLRGMSRERRARAVPLQQPYLLSLHEDRRLLLADPETGRHIDLASFGPDNASVFLRWLPRPEGAGRQIPTSTGGTSP